MHRPSRIDWTGARERKAKRIRLIFVLCLTTVIMVALAAFYLNKISLAAAGQPARYSGYFGGAQMHEVAANEESQNEESQNEGSGDA